MIVSVETGVPAEAPGGRAADAGLASMSQVTPNSRGTQWVRASTSGQHSRAPGWLWPPAPDPHRLSRTPACSAGNSTPELGSSSALPPDLRHLAHSPVGRSSVCPGSQGAGAGQAGLLQGLGPSFSYLAQPLPAPRCTHVSTPGALSLAPPLPGLCTCCTHAWVLFLSITCVAGVH